MSFSFISAASTKTKTVTKSVTAGNLLICDFAGGDGTSVPSISDGVNTWTPVGASPVADTVNGQTLAMWWAVALTTASITITITDAPTTFNGTSLSEYSGNAASSLDAGSAGTPNIAGSTGSNAMQTGAFTPSVSGCLIHSFIADDGHAVSVTQFTAGTSPVVFTKRATASQDPAGLSDVTYAVQDAVQTIAASINPTWTETAADAAVGLSAAFKPAVPPAALPGQMGKTIYVMP